jgi:hypothetical protein
MLSESNLRCKVHEKESVGNVQTTHNISRVAKISFGGDPNPLGFYSTTHSANSIDWLPTLNREFKLHLQVGPPKPVEHVRTTRKQETGFSKNGSKGAPFDGDHTLPYIY